MASLKPLSDNSNICHLDVDICFLFFKSFPGSWYETGFQMKWYFHIMRLWILSKYFVLSSLFCQLWWERIKRDALLLLPDGDSCSFPTCPPLTPKWEGSSFTAEWGCEFWLHMEHPLGMGGLWVSGDWTPGSLLDFHWHKPDGCLITSSWGWKSRLPIEWIFVGIRGVRNSSLLWCLSELSKNSLPIKGYYTKGCPFLLMWIKMAGFHCFCTYPLAFVGWPSLQI